MRSLISPLVLASAGAALLSCSRSTPDHAAPPNGALFIVESDAGRVKVVRGADRDGGPEKLSVFATGLRQPFGVAFYPPAAPRWVYVANTDSVVRFPYADGDLAARGRPETV